MNDHIRSVADRFADEGYLAVAPQLFHRDGSPEIPYDDFSAAMPFMANLTKQGLTNDLNATTDFLATLGFHAPNIAAVGFCMGGTVSFFAATLGTIGAAASFYGGGVATGRFGLPPLVELAAELRCPWLGLYGDLDQSIPPEQVEALRDATGRGVSHDRDRALPRGPARLPLRRAARRLQRGGRARTRDAARAGLLRRAPAATSS